MDKLNQAIAAIQLNFSDAPANLKIQVSNYCLYVINTPASVDDVIGNAVDCAPIELQDWFYNCRIDSLEAVETLAKQLHDLNWLENDSEECQQLHAEFADLCEFMIGVDDPHIADFFYAEIQKISSKYSVYY